MKTIFYLILVTIISFSMGCSSESTEDSEANSQIVSAESTTKTAICMWNKLSLRETPSAEGKYITAGNMGELMTYLDSTVTDESSDKKREYALVKLSDGTEGWMRNDLIVIDAELAVITKKAAICQRADLITKTDKSFEPMDIIAIKKSENGWANVKGIIKDGTWYTEGWVQESVLSYRSPDITDAILITKALTIKNEDDRVEELKRIYALENGDGYSEFKPTIKLLIGGLSTLDQRAYDAYKCWFTNEPADYNFSTDGETITILGNQYGEFYYSAFGAVYQFANCLRAERTGYEVLEAISGIGMYTSDYKTSGFDYINPEFVKWASNYLIPTAEDDFLDVNLKQVYKIVIREKVRKLDDAYYLIQNEFPDLTQDYKHEVQEGGQDALEFLSNYMQDRYNYEYGWYAGFWARRSIDGSSGELRKALDKILEEYDREYVIDRMG
jgi:hypothetical protein